MSRMYYNAITVLCLAAVFGVFARGADADTIYLYDFSRVTSGIVLNGQDGWYDYYGSPTNGNIVASGASGWGGNYVEFNEVGESSFRLNDANWSFNLVNNQNFDFSCDVRVSYNKYYAYTTVYESANLSSGKNFRAGVQTTKLYWIINNTAYTLNHNVPTASDRIYRVGVEVTALGSGNYSAQRYYQDLTTPGARTNTGSAISFSNSDITGWDFIHVETVKSGDRVDNIRFDVVPEPSTLALLAAGLIGLLAYAWRKRK